MPRFNASLIAVALAGCASHPGAAPTPSETHQVKIDASNVEAVQKAGYKLVNRDGEKLFCRTDPITGSRLQLRTTCLTEQELYDQMNATQQSMGRVSTRVAPPSGR
ncbi:MAG: hypothetical protein JWN85_4929 [Gammaproteobacteria bacterium]|nr:hypothetical protein [Gammaproteobacteria bacterium]